jgi:PhnB protein
MAKKDAGEQLDQIVERLLGGPDAPVPREKASRPFAPSLGPVIEVVSVLRALPRSDFKARLRMDLERRAKMASSARTAPAAQVTAIPYLCIKGAAAAIEFYKKAFGATESPRFVQPDGRIGHAEININGARVMLSDEFPEIGFRSPESLGGSPILIHLGVEDADAVTRRAVAAGMKVVQPIEDRFYGDRSGQLADPFGYTWIVSTHKEDVPVEELRRRMQELFRQQAAASTQETQASPAVKFIRQGFHTITPYLIIPNASGWIEFVKQAFRAEEHFRVNRPGTETIMHAEVKIGDSMIELADASDQIAALPSAIWLRVGDVDAAYQRAIKAGATPIHPPTDQDYDSRDGSVKDMSGNNWYLFTPTPRNTIFAELRSVTPYLHPVRSDELIEFLQKAFGAEEQYRAQSPDGVVHHAQVRIGDSTIGMGDAHGVYEPMPSTLHLYVPDTDSLYERALRAGATSIQPPADQPYGDRSAGVTDPFGNRWFIATHTRGVTG